jgi:uncharacterized protein (DUF1499 family)
MTKRLWWLAGLGLAALAAAANRFPSINDVTTGQTPEYPDLQPRQYPADPQTVFHAVQAVAAQMPGWQVTSVDAAAGVLQAAAWVIPTPFTDDVTVRVEPVEGGSRVQMRSHSRVGKADLGVNARRIRTFLRALDRQMQGSRGPRRGTRRT